jgi:cysteinyl-tRNA synthetase
MVNLRLYNTLTRAKEDFVPIDPGNVRLYVCGPTVYDYAHIGNARPVIVFDLLFRLLRQHYGEDAVTYVRNITDVDDKINARAARDYPELPLNEAIREVTRRTEEQFHADIRALGVLMPDDVNEPGKPRRFIEPRATEHIAEMRRLIEELVANRHAYVAEEHVLFDVPSMPDYGSLSKRPLDEMEAGARVDVAPYKRSPLDFVLWKPSKPDEPAWPSPAGIAAPGRPGWHIECSAMAWKHLGKVFDIHAGGIDLVFPHHENEIAQSRCCFDTPVMANVWMHNGFLQVEGDKMSKSLGNFVTIHDLLKDWPGEVLRLNMLRTHYRQPIDWTVKGMQESERTLDRWYGLGDGDVAPRLTRAALEALADDLNTPKMLAELYALETVAVDEAVSNLRALGFLGESREAWDRRRRAAIRVDAAAIEALIASRKQARGAKNWAESDRIRDELAAMGVVLKDNKDGTTTWEPAR